MKTLRVQLEETLLFGASMFRAQPPHPALREIARIEDRIRALVSGNSATLHRDLLLEIGDLAMAAYAHRGVSREEIASNPATVPLVTLLLLVLDRYGDGLQNHVRHRTVMYWRMVAHAFFLVRPAIGRPGPFTAAQKSELKRSYAAARKRALNIGKKEAEAHQLGLVAAYQSVRPSSGGSSADRKEHLAQIKRVLKYAGLGGPAETSPKLRRAEHLAK